MMRALFSFVLRCIVFAVAIAAGALWLTKPWSVA